MTLELCLRLIEVQFAPHVSEGPDVVFIMLELTAGPVSFSSPMLLDKKK